MIIKDPLLGDYVVDWNVHGYQLQKQQPNGTFKSETPRDPSWEKIISEVVKRQIAEKDGEMTIAQFHDHVESVVAKFKTPEAAKKPVSEALPVTMQTVEGV